MVFFLLERGADQEHKTDEMHTALMEASMVRNLQRMKSKKSLVIICTNYFNIFYSWVKIKVEMLVKHITFEH